MNCRSTLHAVVFITLPALPMAGAAEEHRLRYIERGDGTVLDTKSGLIWLKNANCLGDLSRGISWPEAMGKAHQLQHGLCGPSDGSKTGDWRLPTRVEMQAMTADASKRRGLGSSTGPTGDDRCVAP